MKIRFAQNEMGINVEYYSNGDWRSAGLFSNESVQRHGGVSNFKTKALHSLSPIMNMQQEQEIVPAGEYASEGQTIICV